MFNFVTAFPLTMQLFSPVSLFLTETRTFEEKQEVMDRRVCNSLIGKAAIMRVDCVGRGGVTVSDLLQGYRTVIYAYYAFT